MIRKIFWSLRFAISELRGEWIFAFGVALAICSVLTPTALLWGTKTGMIDTMRTRLVKDPVIRQLVGQENTDLPVAWFTEMRKDPRVSFVVPSVRRISLYGNVSTPGKLEKKEEVGYLPTAEGDPVGGGVDWNPQNPQFPIPCMISSRVAEAIDVQQGSRIIIEQTRFEKGGTARALFEAQVQRVLAPHESNLKAVYLPLAVIERIEDYKDGQAVPVFDWNKSELPSMLIYDSFRLRLQNVGDGVELNKILLKLKEGNDLRLNGDIVKGSLAIYGEGEGIDYSQILEIMRMFASYSPVVKFQVDETVTRIVEFQGGKTHSINFSVDESSWLSYDKVVGLGDMKVKHVPANPIGWFNVPCSEGKNSRLGMVISEKQIQDGIVSLSPYLVGVLSTAKYRPVVFNEATAEFRPVRGQYPGFRLYARSLEDVKPLRQYCATMGVKVSTKEDRIDSVLFLDSALGKFLAFIIVAGGVGGIGALFTSLYLSIERSRRQFAVLQIIGIPRFYVLVSTILQATFMVIVGALFSFILFQVGSLLLSSILATGVSNGGEVCSLSTRQWIILLVVSLACAMFSALLAFLRLRFKDPALIARSE